MSYQDLDPQERLRREMSMRSTAVEILHAARKLVGRQQTIDPRDFWRRLQDGFDVALSSATNVPTLWSGIARQLQIETFDHAVSSLISSIARELADPDDFSDFRQLCLSEVQYLVVQCMAERDQEREAKAELREEGLA